MPGTPSVADITRLVSGLGDWVSRFAGVLRRVVVVVAATLAGTALLALVLGLSAWGDSPVEIAVVAVLTVPGIVAPVISARRTRALAAAAADPTATAEQARALFARVRGGTDLSELLERATAMPDGKARTIRGFWRTSRALAAVIDSTRPDPRTEPLLIAFEPARLKTTWWFLLTSVWMWLLSLTVCFVAAMTLIADQLT